MSTDFMERLYDTDVVGKLQPFVNRHEIGYDFIGDEWLQMHETKETNTPWLVHKRSKGQLCHIFHTTYFGIFGCVPELCFKHCWKLAACNKGVKDDQVQQLCMRDVLDIEELQQELDLPSKCGMDRRDYTQNIWGSFWYTSSLDEAKEKYPIIRDGLDKIDPNINLVIKRSCTEFELAIGPSDTWDDMERPWSEKEDVLNDWILRQDSQPEHQHELIKRNVKIKMLQWAYKHGDNTYRLFNEGNDLVMRFPKEDNKSIVPSITYKP